MTQLLERNEYDTLPLAQLSEEQKAQVTHLAGQIASVDCIGFKNVPVSNFTHETPNQISA